MKNQVMMEVLASGVGRYAAKCCKMLLVIACASFGLVACDGGSVVASSVPAMSSSEVTQASESSVPVTSASASSSVPDTNSMDVPADASLVFAINAGAAAAASLGGVTYSPDRFATGGTVNVTADAITGVVDYAVYQSERYGSYAYEIPVTMATYSVKLHFVEMFHNAAEARLFNVNVEGQPSISELDVFAEVGSNAAYDVVINNIAVSDGKLSIELTTVTDNATISGIAIYSNDGGQYEEPPEPVCNDAQRQIPRAVNYATEFNDPQYFDNNVARSPTGARGFVIEQASATLPNHTIYRPQTLTDNDNLPIVAWGNGGCSNDGLSQADFLSEIASHGYIVIANGAPGGGGNNDQHETELVKAIDWAIAENGRECSQFYGKLNVEKIAAMGWSCGGGMAHYAAIDPRVDTGVALNSGLYSGDRFGYYDRFRTPIAIFNGNQSDVAYSNGLQAFDEITNVPVYHANHANLGHGDAYFQDNGGDLGKAAVGWLNFQLKDDMSETGRGRFFGNNCFMCRAPWTSKSKDF